MALRWRRRSLLIAAVVLLLGAALMLVLACTGTQGKAALSLSAVPGGQKLQQWDTDLTFADLENVWSPESGHFGQQTRRTPSNADYDACRARGADLRSYLESAGPDDGRARSQFMNYGDLWRWGWVKFMDQDADVETVQWLSEIQRASSVPVFSNSEAGRETEWSHNERRRIDGVVYFLTHAHYQNIYYPRDGLIVAINNWGPEYQVQTHSTGHEPWVDDRGYRLPVVKLKNWSDVVYLDWQDLREGNPALRGNLQRVVRRKVVDVVSMSVITTIAREHGPVKNFNLSKKRWQAPVWPGIVITPSREPDFDALLGSPNVRGIVWLLIQHRAQLGTKSIKSIRIWLDKKNGENKPNMLVELGAA